MAKSVLVENYSPKEMTSTYFHLVDSQYNVQFVLDYLKAKIDSIQNI